MKSVRCFLIGICLLSGLLPGIVRAQETVEKSIYIPYQEFWRVFEQKDRGVFLPYDEYRALVEKAEAAQKDQHKNALTGTLISELEGRLEAGDTVARGTVRLVVEVFSPGWHEIPVRLDRVTLTSAQLDGTKARLRRDAKRGYVLLLEHKEDTPTTHNLELSFSVPLDGEAEKAVTFPLPDVAVNRWTFVVPEAGVSFAKDSPLAMTRLAEGRGTSVELLLAGHKNFAVKWTPEVEGAMNMQPVLQAEIHQVMAIHPDIIRSGANVVLRIDRAPVEQVRFQFPASERVVDVKSEKLRSWTATPLQDGLQQVTVEFQEPEKGQVTLQVDSERYELPGVWTAPVLKAEGVARQLGSFRVNLESGLRAETRELSGLSRLDLSGENRNGTPALGWSYRSLPATLQLSVEAVQPEIELETLTVVHVEPEEVTQYVRARFDVKRSGVFQLSLMIPEGVELEEPAAGGLDRHETGPAADGWRRVDFDFARRVQGKVELSFRLVERELREALRTPTGEEVELSVQMVRGTGENIVRESGQVIIGSPAFLTLRKSSSENVLEVPWREATGNPAGGFEGFTQPQLGFRYEGEEPTLSVTARRKEPFVTVDQFLVMHAASGVVKFRSELSVQVQYSGVPHLRLDVPADLADRIRILNKEIRKKELEAPADLAEGMRAWMLEGPAEFIGTSTISLEWEQPLPGMDVGVRQDVDIPHLMPRGVDRALGQIVLRKAESMDVIVRETGPELTPMDPRHDLTGSRSLPDAALAYEFQRDWQLTATLVKYEPVNVKATSIERGWVRQVVTRGGEISVQALYQMRSVRQRLEVILPAEAEFDAQPLYVNGRAVSLERGGENQVYLPLTGFRADEAVLLELRYNLPAGGSGLSLPHFPEDPAVQKVYLSVHLPENRVYLGHRGGWNPEYIWRVRDGFRMVPSGTRGASFLWNWVNEQTRVEDSPLDRLSTDGQYLLFSSLRPQTEGATLNVSTMSLRLFYVLVISGGILLGLLLVRCAVRTRLVVSILLVSLLAFAGVFFPSLAHAVINDATAAAVLLVLMIWGAYDLVLRLPAARKALPERKPLPSSRPKPPPVQAPPPPETQPEEDTDHA